MTTTRPAAAVEQAKPLKRHTEQIADEPITQRTTALCPICRIDRPTFRDRIGKTYFVRHMQAGHGCWCPKSVKEVKE